MIYKYAYLYKYIFIYLFIYIYRITRKKPVLVQNSEFHAMQSSAKHVLNNLNGMRNYLYHIEGAVFSTIWCSMYKVQSVDSRNAEKEKTDSLLLWVSCEGTHQIDYN